MNSLLLNRATGSLPVKTFEQHFTTRLLHALQPSDTVFAGARNSSRDTNQSEDKAESIRAHNGGVNALTIDRFDGQYLLSAGADASIKIWNLENFDPKGPVTHRPLGVAARGATGGHKHGITAIHFFPFDTDTFTSSSYDHTLKMWSSETLAAGASFDLQSVIYHHATSPIADHLLVACATQHSQIRLVDLRSGAAAQSLAGHDGAVMSLAWSPKDEHVLASGGIDGTIRFWDVRRSAPQLGTLDMEDSIGIGGYDGAGLGARHYFRGKAHHGTVNGLAWTEDGRHLVSAGRDEKLRVWDVIKGANTLASFGPLVRNTELRTCLPCLPSPHLVQPGREALFFPSDKEILMFELFEGKMLKRMKTPGLPNPSGNRIDGSKSKVNELAWRHHHVELYSAHGDGTIRAWKPRTTEDALAEKNEDEAARAEEQERQKKRKALQDIYDDLTKKRMTL